jgi:hypothetical protein
MKYQEPVLPHLFQLYNEEDMGVQEHPGDGSRGKQKQANSSHRTLWQVSPTHPPSQKFAYRAVLEPTQNTIPHNYKVNTTTFYRGTAKPNDKLLTSKTLLDPFADSSIRV